MEHTRKRDTITVMMAGELDHCSAQGIRRELDHFLEDPSVRNLVLDMRQMTFMDSSGIGVILGRYRTLSQRGGKLQVTNMNAQIGRIFQLSGMGQIIQIV